mgnify:CR=1 FL=1|tara:strand:+ start:62 stop:448 length:387 start_codon:yes stop_codon:yes gene_type:complete
MVARPTRKRMYRTMQGRMVDIEKLRMANESVQAVGNMKVNARGDVLGAGGKVITKKAEVIQKYYEQPKGMADSTPARAKKVSAPKPKAVETKKVATPRIATPKATTKATQKKTVAPKKGIDEALDGLE